MWKALAGVSVLRGKEEEWPCWSVVGRREEALRRPSWRGTLAGGDLQPELGPDGRQVGFEERCRASTTLAVWQLGSCSGEDCGPSTHAALCPGRQREQALVGPCDSQCSVHAGRETGRGGFVPPHRARVEREERRQRLLFSSSSKRERKQGAFVLLIEAGFRFSSGMGGPGVALSLSTP